MDPTSSLSKENNVDLSAEHIEERRNAARNPANQTTLSVLSGGSVSLYEVADPLETDHPIVTIQLKDPPATLDETNYRIVLNTPLLERVENASENGSAPVMARFTRSNGGKIMDVTVSVEGAGGEIQMEQTEEENGQPVARLRNGEWARIIGFTFQG